jgi:dTDP-glucose 4,6-dehydratase
MATVLITGAAGFLGTRLVEQRKRSRPQDKLILLDNFSHGAHPAQMMSLTDHDRIMSVVGDVRDGALVSELIRTHEVSRIIHCASVDTTASQSMDAAAIMDNNVSGTLMLLEAARLVWSQKALHNVHFHYVSCADALTPTAEGLITDDLAGHPETLYAASKLNAENLVLAYAQRYTIRSSISRPTTMFGPRQFPSHTVAATIINLLDGRKLPIFGAGTENLNLVQVDDVARGIDLAIDSLRISGVFGLDGDTLTQRDMIGLICRSIDDLARSSSDFALKFPRCPASSGLPCSTLITVVQDRRHIARARQIEFRKAREQLNYTPRAKLVQSMADTVAWYADNSSWWRGVINGQHLTRMDFALAG